MLEETIDRVMPIIDHDNVRVVTGESMGQFINENIDSLDEHHLITEPEGRNTCVAIGLAAVHLAKDDPEAVMVVLSADHIIKPPEKLCRIIQAGVEIAKSRECLMTIGIVPTRAETGYGYIKLGKPLETSSTSEFYEVSAFTEKPKAAIAHEYYYSGKFLWNSGMFIWSAQSILNTIARCQPELHQQLSDYAGKVGTADEAKARQELYEKVVPVSIDVAVLEKADNVLTIKADIVWDDIGGWNALSRYKPVDSDNNVMIGEAVTAETYECTIYNDCDEGIIACLGVADLVVVRSGEITLVVHKTKAAEVKNILKQLENNEDWQQYL